MADVLVEPMLMLLRSHQAPLSRSHQRPEDRALCWSDTSVPGVPTSWEYYCGLLQIPLGGRGLGGGAPESRQ